MGEPASEDHIKRVERELAKEDSLLANMIQQAPGMLGMAFMFVITILLGLWLQPWFESSGLQAFGESGSTQARWVGLQLVAIFAFTFVILWLAKNHLQHVIKYGLLFVLFLALCYTTVPGAHILLVPEIETEDFEFTNSIEINEDVVSFNSDGTMITNIAKWRVDNSTNNTFEISKRAADTTLEWSWEINAMPGGPDIRVMEGDYAYTATNGDWIWSFDKETGETLSKYACFDEDKWNGTQESYTPITGLESCFSAVEVIENPEENKGALYIITSGSEMVRINTFDGDENTNMSIIQARWEITQLQMNNPGVEVLHMSQYDEDSILFATSLGATMIHLEKNSKSYDGPGSKPPNWVDSSTTEWVYEIENQNNLTTFNIVESIWDDDDQLIMAGFEDGMIKSWIIDEDYEDEMIAPNEYLGIFEEEDRFKGGDSFEGPISAINSFDLDGNNGNELWIADADGIHGLFYEKLIEYATLDIVLDGHSQLSSKDWEIQAIGAGTWEDNLSITHSSVVIDSGEFDPDTMYNSYGIQWDDTAFFLGIGLAIILMVALIIRPEWYVVNTVGVLVGAGVIVMLGVTFVPTLIVIFMVLAAIYDAWAVYRSKHMLDLADTMIGLNLPILLVAPQESGYSMLDEKSSIRPPEQAETKVESVAAAPVKMKKRKKPKEAMFMGLGDVIFPGMLVISCVNFISSGGLEVGISALIGGLVGYFVLMAYVASGRPQAGLPLLNGGAILGYIIGGLIFVGSAAFSFGISL